MNGSTLLHDDLVAEIDQLIDKMDGSLDANWIVLKIISLHLPREGQRGDRKLLEMDTVLRKLVPDRVRRARRATGAWTGNVPVASGMARLRRRYPVNIGGNAVAVEIDEMTDAQLFAKADELDLMGEGCHQHAEEIRRYVDQRCDRSRA